MRQLFAPAIRLMYRLKYPQKFLIISLLFVVPLALVMVRLIGEIDTQIAKTQHELDGIAYLRPLRQLYQHALQDKLLGQQYLDGPRQSAALVANQAQIDRDFAALAGVDQQYGALLLTTPQFTKLQGSWTTLKVVPLDVRERQALQTSFITDTRSLIHGVGDSSNLILDSDLDSHYVMDTILVKLPELQSYLTDAAFLGDAVVTHQRYTAAEHDQVVALHTLIQADTRRARVDATKHMVVTALNAPLDAALQPTDRLLDVLKANVIDQPAPQTTLADYRAASALPLPATFSLWDQAVDKLNTLLVARIDGLTGSEFSAGAVTVAVLLLVVYLWVGFYFAVMDTVSHLKNAAQRMVRGDIVEQVSLDNRDELGQVATAFNTVATALVSASTYRQAVVDNAAEGIITTDALGRISSFNQAAEEIFGYSAAEVAGQNFLMLLDGTSVDAGREPTLQDVTRPRARREVAGQRRDGSTFPMDLTVSQMQVGTARSFICVLRDITERKQAEADLQQAKEAAETANQAKSAFLANMSHEIRTPMNAVIGMTSLLLDTDLTPEQQDYAETVRNSSDSLLTIINDILDFSKIEAGKLDLESHPFDLRECLESSLDLLAGRAGDKGLDLAYLLDAGTPSGLLGDVTRLRQILVNLVSNAVKFTDHGEVVVSVAAELIGEPVLPLDPSSPQPPTPNPPEYRLHFAVRDTGIGIPADRMDRLFRSFSQVDASTTRRYGGTGLGLVISKRLAELMGGTMWVESEVGRGTTFHFTIQAAAVPSPARWSLEGRQPQLVGKCLLIVDDNATNRQILTRYALAWGMVPKDTESPREALDWVRRGEPFDLAVLDMQMPEMDGLALAAEIRRLRDATTLPLVMLTSIGRRDAEVRAAGFAAYLTKPIKSSQLYNAIVSIFAGQPAPLHETAEPQLDARMAQRLPLRILLAEDNVVNQKLALRILDRMGYRADIAGNGLEVLEALMRQPYDIVFMDVQMPEMDGLETSQHIRAQWPDAAQPRIIAMTANAMQGDREMCLAAGMDDYLSKPIQLKEVQQALERWEPRAAPTSAPPAAPLTARPVPAPAAPAAIDQAFLADLRRELQMEGEPDVVQELIEIFLDSVPGLITTLRDAVAQADAPKIHHLAHTLKGSSSNLGATRLAALSAALEKQGRTATLTDAPGVLTQLEQEFDRVRRALEDEQHSPSLSH